jgi:hypothetical protein
LLLSKTIAAVSSSRPALRRILGPGRKDTNVRRRKRTYFTLLCMQITAIFRCVEAAAGRAAGCLRYVAKLQFLHGPTRVSKQVLTPPETGLERRFPRAELPHIVIVNTLVPFTGYDVARNQPRPSSNLMNHKKILIGAEIVLWRGSSGERAVAAA